MIVDAEDESNGFATPLPFPFVTIHAAGPNGSDAFGNHEGWLRLALTHELAHVVHLEEGRGLWGLGRRALRARAVPVPERVRHDLDDRRPGHLRGDRSSPRSAAAGTPTRRMVLRMAALDGRFPKEDQAIYALEAWPGGQTPYLFGEAFLRDLTEQSGEDTHPATRTPARHADHPVSRRPHGQAR